MPIELLKKVRHDNSTHTIGAVLTMPKKDEKRLVDMKYARYVKTVDEATVINPPAEEIDPVYYKETYADLKAAYNKTSLEAAASDVGVVLPEKALLDDIIDAIIRQGKVDDLLTDEEE